MQPPKLTVSISPEAGSKISFNDGFNKVKITYSSDMSLVYEEIRVTKEGEDYDIGIGKLVHHMSGSIAANTQHVCEFDVNAENFSQGNGTYVISIYAKNQPDGSWSEYHYFFVYTDDSKTSTWSFIPSDADDFEVVTDQTIPE